MKKQTISKSIQLEHQELMLYRVQEILLVASPYDTFVLQEDGRLTELILNEYRDMHFSQAPRLWIMETGKSALEFLTKCKIDVVVVMLRIADIDTIELCSKLKQQYPEITIILLIFDEYEIEDIPSDILFKNIDKIFIWKGNPNIFLGMMKWLEDKNNAQRDILEGGVRSIIFIEDNPHYYSMILPILYKEIMYHTRNLIDDSLDETNQLLHLRGRTKILLATSYEEAENYFTLYRDNILGIISDVKFPKNGISDYTAGIQFTNYIREFEPYMPVVIQSSHLNSGEKAKSVNADFLYKHSKSLISDLRKFMLGNFGFGEFVFRDFDGNKISSASDVQGLYNNLQTLPHESILFHSNFNHFSNWLANRGEFKLASLIRPVNVADFDDAEELRNYLVKSVATVLNIHIDKQIQNFSLNKLNQNIPLLRIGKGSLGGKGRGLLFMNRILADSDIHEQFPNVKIRIPEAVVVGTKEFDKFIKNNDLLIQALNLDSNKKIVELFLTKSLSPKLISTLEDFLEQTKYPLAVRSSSLLEDSKYQPLAGLYSTFMLPNSSTNKDLRLRQLCAAIIKIYASVYFSDPIALIENSNYHIEEEKMAIIIMEMVGQKFENRFYPTISGVVRNINYYPVSYMERDEGIAMVAVGLGKGVMEGERALRFSPKYPDILPQYFSINETLKNSQNTFYALDLKYKSNLLNVGESDNLIKCNLELAEKDKQLFWVGSVISTENNIIRDSLNYKGPRVITFAQILKWKQFPLSDILVKLLKIGKAALGNPIEIEFSINLNRKNDIAEFYILQIRPMYFGGNHQYDEKIKFRKDDLLCKSSVALGNGSINDIKDIVYVDIEKFNIAKTRIIAGEVEYFNNILGKDNPFLLIGPGRWGTADEWLGIPVDWNQISNTKAIVEIGMEKLPIDPSFGTHFFQNITGMRIGYFTVSHKLKEDNFNDSNFNNLPVREQLEYTTCFHLDNPLVININGKTGEGTIAKFPEITMDEGESSGI